LTEQYGNEFKNNRVLVKLDPNLANSPESL
jgi:hypothetical protein